MTPEEKIQYVKNQIDELTKISPMGPKHICLSGVVEYEGGPEILSVKEQRLILEKLEEDGYLKDVWPIDDNDFWVEKSNKDLLGKNDKKLTEFLTLTLDFNKKTREIKINGILIAKPNFNSNNHSLFEYLFANAGNTLKKSELEKILKIKIKPFNDFLNDIKIKKTIRKYLVHTSKGKVRLTKHIEIDDYDDIQRIRGELKDLRKVETGGNQVK
jgi:hypothetical protein